MQIIPLGRPLTAADRSAIRRLRRISGSNPFACLGDSVMLLLTPGGAQEALLREAQGLMADSLSPCPGLFLHKLPGGQLLARTQQGLCILARTPGAPLTALLREGQRACLKGRALALVLPDGGGPGRRFFVEGRGFFCFPGRISRNPPLPRRIER